jgi:hypothetical protein
LFAISRANDAAEGWEERFVRRVLGSLAIALAFVVQGLLQPGLASAYSVISETGLHGDYSLAESNDSPATSCVYGKEVPPDGAWFRFMRVKPPTVFAADRNSAIRDHRKVSWQFKIQVMPFSGGSWQKVASSSIQKATAYEDLAAPFSAMKVYWKPSRTGPNAGALKVRTLIVIRWYKPGGAIEGTVKLTADYYYLKMPWANTTSGQPYCQDYTTAG